MLKRHANFFQNLLFCFDLVLISGCWLGAYYLRFESGLAPVTKGIPPLVPYLWLLVLIMLVWGVSFQAFNLYRPRRMGSLVAEFVDVAKAHTVSAMILVALWFLIRHQFEYSRLTIIFFWLIGLVSLGFSRALFRMGLGFLRRLGFNLRHVVVIGTGKSGQKLVACLTQHPELGFKFCGYLTCRPEMLGKILEGVPIIGTYEDMKDVLARQVDLVFVCLSPEDEEQGEKILGYLSTTMLEVKVIPAEYEFITLRAEAEMFGGLPVLTLQGSPLYGWNVVVKRGMDVVGSLIALIVMAPLLLCIAMAIKMSSPGPVLYRQTRMGLDGQAFKMLKLRSMQVDAESETGPVWARKADTRRTAIGTFLRETSLDELPQFWNVLKGEMSIVGPRPERPEFIAQFREKFPHYMLRHKMKAGITGWAQVNGWRGNTSLEKRLEYDLYYIEHWSVLFDLKIMLMTVWKGFIHKHAY